MHIRYFLCLFLLVPLVLPAQKHDYFWFFGYGGGYDDNDDFGVRTLDFNAKPFPRLSPIQENYGINFSGTAASICDSAGNLLLDLLPFDNQHFTLNL